jgi:hypothetical protein
LCRGVLDVTVLLWYSIRSVYHCHGADLLYSWGGCVVLPKHCPSCLSLHAEGWLSVVVCCAFDPALQGPCMAAAGCNQG